MASTLVSGVLFMRLASSRAPFHEVATALPAYNLELSTVPEPAFPRWNRARLRRDDALTIVARPATPVEGPIEARAFLDTGDGHLQSFPISFQQTASGALIARRWPIPTIIGPGRFGLTVLVGRPASLPSDATAAQTASPSADWLVLEGTIEISPP